MVQDADFGLPPHIVASQVKNKKRKRDDSKKASKGTPAFLRVQTQLEPFSLLLCILTMPGNIAAAPTAVMHHCHVDVSICSAQMRQHARQVDHTLQQLHHTLSYLQQDWVCGLGTGQPDCVRSWGSLLQRCHVQCVILHRLGVFV